MAEKNFRNGAKSKSKKLPFSFYGNLEGGTVGNPRGQGVKGTIGARWGDYSLEASGGNLGVLIPNKQFREAFGVTSQAGINKNLDEIKATLNLSDSTNLSVIVNPKGKGVYVKINQKF